MSFVPIGQKTIWSELGTQVCLISEIKKPLLESLPIILDPGTSKIARLRVISRLWGVVKSISALPQPTVENTWHPNSHNLIEIRDSILSSIKGLSRERLFFVENIFKIIIVINEMDPPWRFVMDSAREQADKMEWKPRGWQDNWVPYKWWDEQNSEGEDGRFS